MDHFNFLKEATQSKDKSVFDHYSIVLQKI